MVKLITELVEDISYITEESEDGEKQFFIEGIIMQSDIANKNGRIYPRDTLFTEVNRYNKEYVRNNKAWGELNHPASPTINLDRVSHIFTELKENGNNIVGKAKVVGTPMGNIVKSLIKEGGRLGISSRGVGTLKKKQGIMEVQNDFRLSTAGDIVADPSAPQAFINGVMENIEWVMDSKSGNWVAIQELESIDEEISQSTIRELEDKAETLFKRFLKTL